MRSLLRYTLDLFAPNQPLAQTGQAQTAIDHEANPKPSARSGDTLTDSLDGIEAYRHPQARREVLLGTVPVAYAFVRSRRRSIGFRVDAQGLSVRAPSWVPLREVEAALRSRGDWILRKLQEQRLRPSHPAASQDWRDGATLPFLGRMLLLRVDSAPAQCSRASAPRLEDTTAAPGLAQVLRLRLPGTDKPAALLERLVQGWLKQQARTLFVQRLDHFAPQLGVQWRSLALSSARTRWGSARSDGSIRLNWRLLHFEPAVIDYVVVHELCHLREMNHSPRFWQLVAGVLPDYRVLRQQLKEPTRPDAQ